MNRDAIVSLLTMIIAAGGTIILAFMLATPAKAVQCQVQHEGRAYWAWREIDGKRCWYRGPKVLPKSLLHWSVTPKKIKPDPMETRAQVIDANGNDQSLPDCCWPTLNEFDLRWIGEDNATGVKP